MHWQIIIGMTLGIFFGLLMSTFSGGDKFINDWIAPFGTIFIKLLKLIAIPLIFTSLVKGISDLKDISSFRNIGVRTILIYISTTIMAITIGLLLVNMVKPGSGISEETIAELTRSYAQNESVTSNIREATQQHIGPLTFLEDMVPDNIFAALSNNGLMLQVIFFAILFGICMLMIDPIKAGPVNKLIDGLNEVILKMVNLIMLMAPFAVFALLAQIVVSSGSGEILQKLLLYGITVLMGLVIVIIIICW